MELQRQTEIEIVARTVERVPYWSSTTILGNRARGSGLLSNALYDGRLVWNKVSMCKDPDTGKRVSRINPESEWQTTAVAHLGIVDAEVFAAAQERMMQRSHQVPAASRKPPHLLSGLLRCAAAAARSCSRTATPRAVTITLVKNARRSSATCDVPTGKSL